MACSSSQRINFIFRKHDVEMAIDGALGYLITQHERPLNDTEQVLSALTSGGISGLLYGNSQTS